MRKKKPEARKAGKQRKVMGFYSGLGFNWVSKRRSSLLGRFGYLTIDRLYEETVPQRNTTVGQAREFILIRLPFHASHWFPHRDSIMMLLGLFGGHSQARFHIPWYGISPTSGSNRRSQRIYLSTGQPGYTTAAKQKGPRGRTLWCSQGQGNLKRHKNMPNTIYLFTNQKSCMM